MAGRPALDVGASTGGFTDCLLQAGVSHVVAVDVAYGELAWQLRSDPRVTVIERCNARALRPDQLPYAPDLIVIDVSFISLAKVLPAVLACAADRFDCLALVKPQFEVGRGQVGKGGVVRDAAARRRRAGGRRLGRARAGRVRARLRQLRAAGPEGEPRDVRVAGRGGGGAGEVDLEARRARGRAVNPVRTATVLTHRRPSETRPAIDALIETRPRAPARSCTSIPRRRASTDSSTGPGLEVDVEGRLDVDICFALGGDGTILTALRRYAGTGVPVFAVNFGEIGFLATVDRDEARSGFERAFARRLRGAVAAGDRAVGRARASGWPSTTCRCTASRATASPISPTRSATTRSVGCAATAWSSPRPPARPATTSPTADR